MSSVHMILVRFSMARANLARASLSHLTMKLSQFGAFLFGTMPVWRVSLWCVSHFCTYVDPVCNFLCQFGANYFGANYFGAYLLFVYFSFEHRIVCAISLLMLSTCRRGYIMANLFIEGVFLWLVHTFINHLHHATSGHSDRVSCANFCVKNCVHTWRSRRSDSLSLPLFPLSGVRCCPQFSTASSDSLFHPPLSLVFFFQSSCSPAFLTSLLTQSSHLSIGLPRLLLPSSRNYAALFGSLSSAILSTCLAHCSPIKNLRVELHSTPR